MGNIRNIWQPSYCTLFFLNQSLNYITQSGKKVQIKFENAIECLILLLKQRDFQNYNNINFISDYKLANKLPYFINIGIRNNEIAFKPYRV